MCKTFAVKGVRDQVMYFFLPCVGEVQERMGIFPWVNLSEVIQGGGQKARIPPDLFSFLHEVLKHPINEMGTAETMKHLLKSISFIVSPHFSTAFISCKWRMDLSVSGVTRFSGYVSWDGSKAGLKDFQKSPRVASIISLTEALFSLSQDWPKSLL